MPPPSSPPPSQSQPLSPPSPSSRAQKWILSTLFLLRFFQLAASAITGFIYCWLIWHHTHHYCSYYPTSCTESQIENVDVPYQYILVTVTGVACFLNVLISTVYFVAVTERVVYPAVLIADGIVLGLYSASLRLVFDVPGSPRWCYYFQTPTNPRANVAARNCVMGQDGKGALACVVGLTGCVVILSAIMTLRNSSVPVKGKNDGERDSVGALVRNSTKSRNSISHISVDIDVAAFMSNEHRMEIGIGDPTGVAEDEKPAKPIEPHPAERLQPGGDMEINEISRRHGEELI